MEMGSCGPISALEDSVVSSIAFEALEHEKLACKDGYKRR